MNVKVWKLCRLRSCEGDCFRQPKADTPHVLGRRNAPDELERKRDCAWLEIPLQSLFYPLQIPSGLMRSRGKCYTDLQDIRLRWAFLQLSSKAVAMHHWHAVV